jgi:putative acetyltransferase
MPSTTKILVRPERVTDYAEIASLHARAFDNRTGESLIVALHRQRRVFDPELSLVAEIYGHIVGHVLFSPHQIRLLDSTVPAVNLAPIAVEPAYQGQGIGGQLITEGHVIAASKGYAVSFLLGHTTYYPRFGYHTHAYGSSQLLLPIEELSHEPLEVRGPTDEDVPALCKLWQREEQGVDMALSPGRDLLDWLSPHPAIQASVYLHESAIVGYPRVHQNEPTRPRFFLAHDAETARAMVSTMAGKLKTEAHETQFTLPLHPLSASAQALGNAMCRSWEGAMARELRPSPLPDYLSSLVLDMVVGLVASSRCRKLFVLALSGSGPLEAFLGRNIPGAGDLLQRGGLWSLLSCRRKVYWNVSSKGAICLPLYNKGISGSPSCSACWSVE